MFFSFKKLFFVIFYNSSLFLILIIGIQNSSNKNRVNLLVEESVELPISFIIGSSFITGSILGAFVPFNTNKKGKSFLQCD
tara:strand:+ start:912 stop:1154 length:243 start_codon:yes stop_codon:yes gene_type:complete